MWIKIISSIILLVAVTSAEQLLVIGSLISRDGDTYKAFVTSDTFFRAHDVAVYIVCDDYIRHKTFTIQEGESLSSKVELKFWKAIYGECIFNSVMREHGSDLCYSDQIAIINDPKFIVMIQTDKPMYKPNDLFRYQIVAIEDTTLPFNLTQVEVDIFDGEDALVSNTLVKDYDIFQPEFGFHQGELKLAEEPNLGVWTIRVKINGFEKATNKTFTVKRYTIPPFKPKIDAPSTIGYRDHKVKFSIGAYYSFDKPVKGLARINATLVDESQPTKIIGSKQIVKGMQNSEEFEIDFKTDLKLMWLVRPVTLVLDVEFEEQSSGVISTASKNIAIVPITKYDFKLKLRPRFIPEFNYHVGVTVLSVDTTSNIKESELKLSYLFKEDGETTFSQGGNQTVFVRLDELASFEIPAPPEEIEVIRLKFNYNGEDYSKDIARESRYHDKSIQILPQKNEAIVGHDFKITVESAPHYILSALTVIVMGRTGLIYSKNHPEANEHSTVEINIPVTKEFEPEADIVVFYLSLDGIPVFDTFKLYIGHTFDNHLDIEVPKDAVKPGDSVTIRAQTEKNSLVAILGGDIALTFLGIGNLISDGYLEEKLSFNIQDYIFKIRANQVFGQINGFILSPKRGKRRHQCTYLEKYLLRQEPSYNLMPLDFEFPSLKPISLTKTSVVRKNFPEIWIYDVKKADSDGKIVLNKVVPETITDFSITGFSISKNKGFTVAKQKLRVFKDFYIKIEKPFSIKLGETVDIQVIVHNYMEVNGEATITLYNRKDQYNFVSGATVSQSLNTSVNSHGTASVTFTIEPKVLGKIFLNIDGKLKESKDEIEDFITVSSGDEISRHITYSSIVDLNITNMLTPIEWEFKIPDNIIQNSVKCSARVSTNLVLPALNLEHPDIDKNILMWVAMSAKQLLKAKNIKADKETEKLLKQQKEQGFQELISLQLNSGGFKLFKTFSAFDHVNGKQARTNLDFLDLTIYVVKLLGQYEAVNPSFNKKPLDKAMKYLKHKQRRDGSFRNSGMQQFRDVSKFSQNGIALTSYAVIAILESTYLKTKYMEIATGGLNFLYNNYYKILIEGTDYERALLFYIYVLAGKDHEELYKKLETTSIVDGDKTYWQVKVGNKYPISLQVETSSYVVLALAKLSNYTEIIPIVNFLSSKRDATGAFSTTTDTVVGFQALAIVSKALYPPNTKMDLTLTNQQGQITTFNVDGDKINDYKNELPATTRKLTLTAKGSGVSNVQVICEYSEVMSTSLEFFSIAATARMEDKETLKIEVCANTKNGSISNLALMEVRLPSGFSYLSGPGANEVDELMKIELRDDNSRIYFYFESLSNVSTCLDIEAKENVRVLNRKDAAITVFDYYERENISSLLYGIST